MANSKEIVELLIEQKAILQTYYFHRTPLMISCSVEKTKNENVAAILIKQGVEVNAKDKNEQTALMYGKKL